MDFVVIGNGPLIDLLMLLALQVYVPLSFSFAEVTEKINLSNPSGFFRMLTPSLYSTIVGEGTPFAEHIKLTVSPTITGSTSANSTIIGVSINA